MLVADVPERSGDSVQERLGTNEAVVGKHVGPGREMLARAEADLEVQRPVVAEQTPRNDLPVRWHFDLRQKRVDQLLLALAQFMAARAPVQAVERQRIAGLERGHATKAPKTNLNIWEPLPSFRVHSPRRDEPWLKLWRKGR